MLAIRIARPDEYSSVRDFYYSLIDAMQNAPFKPGWQKGIYPSDAYLKESIEKQELFIGLSGDDIAAAMIVNHNYNESYDNVQWPTPATPDEITVVHALGVHSRFSGKGFGKAMAAKAIDFAKEQQQKAIRLDVLGGNLPAEKLYTGIGFQYVDTIQMFYEDTGWTDFKLYELPITNNK